MYSVDLRWRAVTLIYIYNLRMHDVSAILGPNEISIKRWLAMFNAEGNVMPRQRARKTSRWPEAVIQFVDQYIKAHPCFYLQELQTALRTSFPDIPNTSIPTICRALRFDLKVSRKTLTKRAREAIPIELNAFISRLRPFYKNADQLVFIDETSKDSRDSVRKYAWSPINSPAVVNIPFGRSKRLSILAALDIDGFFAFEITTDTFDREKFHNAMISKIMPLLNPYPLPRSILILDNARIHVYQKLIDAVYDIGALIFFLPPYSPHLNPIEYGFASLKTWIKREAFLVFKKHSRKIIPIAMKNCIKQSFRSTFTKCGYGQYTLVGDLDRSHNLNDIEWDHEETA